MAKEEIKKEKDLNWNENQNLGSFFNTLNKIESSGVSAIITREEKKITLEEAKEINGNDRRN